MKWARPLPAPAEVMARVMQQVEVSGDCWEWRGRGTTSGYGNYRWPRGWKMPKDSSSAHRLLYILRYGDVPAGVDVCHTCDNRRCVRPAHMWLGSRQENMQDCVAKGRHVSGFSARYRSAA